MQKKFFKSLLLFLFLFLLGGTKVDASALSYNNAYSGIVKIKLFSTTIDGYLTLSSYGSGAIISSDGLILTNYHVISEKDDFDESEKDVAYQLCLTKNEDEEPVCEYTADFIAGDEDKDFALLKIKNISGLSSALNYEYFDLSDEEDIETSSDITIFGYPTIGGETLTTTKGTISGKEEKYDLDWLKTDASISFGNSGGVGLNDDGEIIGLTTQAYSDMLDSLGYLIDVNSLRDWVNDNKDNNSQKSPLENRLIEFTNKEKNLKTSSIFKNNIPAFQISKEDGWEFYYYSEGSISILNENPNNSANLHIDFEHFPFDVDLDDIEDLFKIENYALLSIIDIVRTEELEINGNPAKSITLSIYGSIIKYYYIPHGEYLFSIAYDYGENDEEKESIDRMMNTLVLENFASDFIKKDSYESIDHNFQVTLEDDNWLIEEFESKAVPFYLYNNQYKDVAVSVFIEERDESTRDLTINEFYNIEISETEDSQVSSAYMGITINILNAESYYSFGDQVNDAIMREIELLKNNELLFKSYMVEVYFYDKIITIELLAVNDENYNEVKEQFFDFLNSINFSDYERKTISEEKLIYNTSFEEDYIDDEIINDTNNNDDDSNNNGIINIENTNNNKNLEIFDIVNENLYQKLKGKILLKVEDSGEAYYISPNSQKAYSLGRPNDAFEVMREQGIGITNSDLNKIPIGLIDVNSEIDTDGDGLTDNFETAIGSNPYNTDTDGDGYLDKIECEAGYNLNGSGKISYDNDFADKQKGKILLQVEGLGEAWYVNPSDGKRYFLGRPVDAFIVMKNLGLGISNDNFTSLF